MVRLKGSSYVRKNKNLDISIPYGAIKSFVDCLLIYNYIFISIPYGAIKSITICIVIVCIINISIPYGAIKRHEGGGILRGANIFQFLMVRLKDSSNPILFLVTDIFQFLMVRLKEFILHCINSLTHISIPYGAIKSRRPR